MIPITPIYSTLFSSLRSDLLSKMNNNVLVPHAPRPCLVRIKFLPFFTFNRQAFVLLDDAGMPQGLVPVIFLFSIFNTDLPPVSSHNHPNTVKLRQHLDDILHSSLRSIIPFKKIWKLLLNSSKCEAIALQGEAKFANK